MKRLVYYLFPKGRQWLVGVRMWDGHLWVQQQTFASMATARAYAEEKAAAALKVRPLVIEYREETPPELTLRPGTA
jgi:hypothetical protein